jgi:hypothetical protein
MVENSDNAMSESELQELRRSIGAPDNGVPRQQQQQAQQQQEQYQQTTQEWEAQKRRPFNRVEEQDDGK